TLAALLNRIMPTAPRCLTLKPFWARPITPRSQTTILPAKAPSGVLFWQSGSASGPLLGATSGLAATPWVSDVPASVRLAPSDEVIRARFTKARSWVLAATVVSHGPRWSTVSAAGPELPAEAATKTPAL